MQVVDFVHVLLHYGDNTRHFNAQQKLMFAGGGYSYETRTGTLPANARDPH